MARINTNQLVANATSLTDRVDQVQRDPAVRKAWSEAGADVASAFRSISSATNETRAAWRRTESAGRTHVGASYA